MKRRFVLMALLLFAPASGILADDDSAIDSSQTGCESAAASASRDFEASVLAFDPEVVTIACQDGLIDALEFRLVPGGDSTVELNVLFHGPREEQFEVRAVAPAPADGDSDGDSDFDSDDSPEWISFDHENARLLPGRAMAVSVTVSPGRQFEPGSVHRAWLEVLVDGERVNALIPIRLYVLEESPLFRSRFEVDPVLGQFSYRPARARSNRIGLSMPAAASGDY